MSVTCMRRPRPSCPRTRSFLRRLSMRNLNIDASIRRSTCVVPVFATGTASQREATRRLSVFPPLVVVVEQRMV